jgi:hypothetical protein
MTMEAPAQVTTVITPPREERVITLRQCDRCGEVHAKALFKSFAKRDIGSWTHWFACPTNGEPVVMRFRSEVPAYAPE